MGVKPETDEAKKKKVSQKYYKLPEEDMQDLLAKSKQGDEQAQYELLRLFNNFLNKYVNLLYLNKYSLQDYDVRCFVALYVTDPNLRRSLSRNKLTPPGQAMVGDTIRGIHYMVIRYCSEEDVRQTVHMAFLHCAGLYVRKESIPFSGFLYRYFFYVLKKQVDTYMIDQLGRRTFPLITDEDNTADSEELSRAPGFVAPLGPGVEDLLGAIIIDENWVAGDTAFFPFDRLTVQERQLLKWRFVDGEKASEIAFRITEHQNTTREAFHRIRRKLKEVLSED